MSNLAGRCQNYKKLLSPLNSAPSICAELKVSSKLKHLPFFAQICGLKHDWCQYWQRLKLTSIKNHKKLLSPLNSASSICAEYKIAPNWSSWNSALKIWPRAWQVPILRSAKFDSRQESQKPFVPIEFAILSLFRVQNGHQNWSICCPWSITLA